MRSTVASLCCAGFGLVSLVGCASLAPQQPDSVATELAELRASVIALQQKNTVTEIELQRLRVKVAELELLRQAEQAARSAPVPAATRPAPALAQVGPEDPIEVAPTGQIVSTDLEPEETEPESSDSALRPDKSYDRMPIERAPVDLAPGGSAPGTGTSTVLTDEAQALYDEGYTQYNLRQFVAAETTFQRFLQRFGNTSLADNAQYWIAEARYSRGDARGALASFRETVTKFPNGNKAPDALLRAGRVYEELGDENAALESYRELVRRFPDSADALLAGDRIRALEGG